MSIELKKTRSLVNQIYWKWTFQAEGNNSEQRPKGLRVSDVLKKRQRRPVWLQRGGIGQKAEEGTDSLGPARPC